MQQTKCKKRPLRCWGDCWQLWANEPHSRPQSVCYFHTLQHDKQLSAPLAFGQHHLLQQFQHRTATRFQALSEWAVFRTTVQRTATMSSSILSLYKFLHIYLLLFPYQKVQKLMLLRKNAIQNFKMWLQTFSDVWAIMYFSFLLVCCCKQWALQALHNAVMTDVDSRL